MTYTQEQLHTAFSKVQNTEHWKNPIDALIDASDKDVTTEAIIHFTGSIPHYTKSRVNELRVQADGYYIAIGA